MTQEIKTINDREWLVSSSESPLTEGYWKVVVRTKDYRQPAFEYPEGQCMTDSGFLVVVTPKGFHHVFRLKDLDYWLKQPLDHADGDASA